MIQVKNVLYGTTQSGGTYGSGVAFSLSASGKEAVLHSFGSGADGIQPNGLTFLNGTFYGTTGSGGANGAGTIFSMTPSGKEAVLQSLGDVDGVFASSGLVAHKGVLYGTTFVGGDDNCQNYGCGTVFSYVP